MATLRLWCQGDDEYFRLYTWKKGNCLSAVCLCRCDLLDEYVETERPSLSISRAESSRLRLRKSPATRPSRPPLRSITAHFMAPTSRSIQPASVWVCVCVIYVMCGSWGRFRLTENLRRVNKQSRTGCADKCVIMLLDLSAVRTLKILTLGSSRPTSSFLTPVQTGKSPNWRSPDIRAEETKKLSWCHCAFCLCFFMFLFVFSLP